MGYSKDCQGKIVYKIKNSWGEDFASKGYFYIEADGLPCGFYEFVDVFNSVPYLPPADIRNYLVHLLSKDTLWRFDESGLTELPGCSSRFEFVEATERICSHQQNHTGIEIIALTAVQGALKNISGIDVSDNGEIGLSGTKHKFHFVATERDGKRVFPPIEPGWAQWSGEPLSFSKVAGSSPGLQLHYFQKIPI